MLLDDVSIFFSMGSIKYSIYLVALVYDVGM